MKSTLWRFAALVVLGASLSGCGQDANDIEQPQPPVEATAAAEPTIDPRLQTTSLPQQGSD